MVFAVSAGTGCSKLWPWGKKPAVTAGTGSGSGLDTPDGSGGAGAGGWGSTDDKLKGGRGGEIQQAHGIAGWPEGDPSTIVYFDFDRSDIKASEQPKLANLAKIMEENPTYAVRVEGNCDERGSAEYNRGLGQRRAEAVRDYLVSLGVAETRIDTLSNGSEKPAVPGAADENAHAKNRRAEFVIGLRAE
jgi:peptidoglycan-associated lipoprotein